MTRVLKSKRIEPRSGEVRSLVVFLHGYGANGDDLLGLAEPLSEHLPDTLFVSPDAPENCTGSPMGFQWFPIPWIDGSSEEESKKGMLSAVVVICQIPEHPKKMGHRRGDSNILPLHAPQTNRHAPAQACWAMPSRPRIGPQ